MKFIIDMNLGAEWAEYLRAVGIDAVHWSSLGNVEADDADIATYAARIGGCVITRDLDFGQLITTRGAAEPSIVLIRGTRVLPRTFGPQVAAALRDHDAELKAGALVTVEASRTRFRVLPIHRQ